MAAMNLQDYILNYLRKGKITCTLHLTNGFQMKNVSICSFDNFSILIIGEGGKQMLVYKHAISSVTPSVPVPMDK